MEQLALQHFAAGTPPPPLERPNYLEIVECAHRSVSSPCWLEEIDANLQDRGTSGSRNLVGKHVYLDASCLIYILKNPAGFPSYVQFLTEVYAGRFRLTASAITLAEVLVQPIKLGRAQLEVEHHRFLTPSDVLSVVAADSAVTIRAAQLRAAYGFRTPDAIHIATGLAAGCDLFLTGDLAWAKAGIQVVTPF